MPLGKRQRSKSPKRVKDPEDPETWTVKELKEYCDLADISKSGLKAELVERVTEHRASEGKTSKPANTAKTAKTTKAAPAKKNSRPSRAAAKKAIKEDESEEEDDFSASEEQEDDIPEAEAEPERKRPRRNKTVSLWNTDGSVIYKNDPESHQSTKIAAFDMDSTLVEPASGKTHPQGRSDWRWWAEEVPTKLKELHKDGYRILIISNQKGIGTGKVPARDITGKIDDLQEDCGVPLSAILSTADDEFRKPSSKMFEFAVEKMVEGTVDLENSYYVGDAAGRAAGWKAGRKKDFGCSDRKFAHNAGLTFYTPEEYFLGEDAADFEWRTLDPKELDVCDELPYKSEDLIAKKQEVILFVGFPASGKSTFAKTYLLPHGYEHVNRDTLSTAAKCLKVTKEALAEGKSVVVDNTSPSVSAREPYIKAAKAAGVPIRCFHFQTSLELAQHMNNFREIFSEGTQRHVPMVGYNMFKKHFVAPKKSEGFTEVRDIEFKRHHPSDQHKKLFEQWTERVR